MLEYAALVVSPRALPDGLILVFQHPANRLFELSLFVGSDCKKCEMNNESENESNSRKQKIEICASQIQFAIH